MGRKSMKGVRMHVIVTQPQHAALEALTQRTGLPMSEIFRRAIDRYLNEAVRSNSTETRASGHKD